MEILKTKILSAEQFHQINRLWNEEYPIQLKDRFTLLLAGADNYNHYVITLDNQVVAWAVDFEKDNETRFSIVVAQDYQGKGLGSLLVNRLKTDLTEFYGWVIDHNTDIKQNGEIYLSPLNFYIKKGFEVMTTERLDTEMIKAVKIKNKGRKNSILKHTL